MKTAAIGMVLSVLISHQAQAESPRFFVLSRQIVKPGRLATLVVSARQAGAMRYHLFHIGAPERYFKTQPDLKRVALEKSKLRPLLTKAMKARGKVVSRYRIKYLKSGKAKLPGGWKDLKLKVRLRRAGLYLIEVNQGRHAGYATALATKITMAVKRTRKGVLAFVVQRKSGRPVPGARVVAYGNRQRLFQGRTDRQGLCAFKLGYRPALRLFAFKNRNLAVDESVFHPASLEGLKVYSFTERPLYKPGEKVLFKGVVRVVHHSGLKVPARTGTVSVSVIDPQGKSVGRLKARLSPRGTFHGAFTLPLKGRQGIFRLETRFAKGSYVSEFKVAKFKKPQFEVVVKPGQRAYVVGEEMSALLKARFYSGEPLPGARVRWTVTRSNFHRPLWQEARYDWYLSAGEALADKPQPVHQGSGILDKGGEVWISWKSKKLKKDQIYVIQAVVFAGHGKIVSGSGSALVTRGAFQLAARPRHQLVKRGRPNRITLLARDYAGVPVSTSLHLEIHALNTTLHRPGGQRGGRRLRRLHEKTISTDDKGSAEVTFKSHHQGEVEFVVRAKDKRGNTIEARTSYWIAAGLRAMTVGTEDLRIITDKKRYNPGEKARILLISPHRAATLLFCAEGDKLHRVKVLRSKGNTALLELDLAEKYAPNLFLTALSVKNGKTHVAIKQLIVLPLSQFITVALKPDKKGFKPRDTMNLEVQTLNWKGKPIPTEVAIAVVDEALYALQPEMAIAIGQFFHHRRRNNVGTFSATDTAFYGHSVHSQRLRERELKRQRAQEKAALARRRRLMVRLAAAGAVSGMAFGGGGMGSSAGMGRAGHRLAEISRRVIRISHAKITGTGRRNALSPVATRRRFKTTIAWFPMILTDAGGRARLKVHFPDNLTSWRITGRSVGQGGQVGQASGKVRTAKAFSLRLAAPHSLTERDRFEISLLLQNNTGEPRPTMVTVKAPGLILDGRGTMKLTVPANGSANASFTALVKTRKPVTIHAEAISGSYNDATTRTIPVSTHGTRQTISQSSLLSRSEQTISWDMKLPVEMNPGSAELTLRLASGPVGAIRSAAEYLALYPYGCAEQTASRLLGNLVAQRALRSLGIVDRPLLKRVQVLARAGVRNLLNMRFPEGGWGWFRPHHTGRMGATGSRPAPVMRRDYYLTAYAVQVLARARQLDLEIHGFGGRKSMGMLLEGLKGKALPFTIRAHILYALSLAAPKAEVLPWAHHLAELGKRKRLSAYTLSLMALAFGQLGLGAEQRAALKELAETAIEGREKSNYWKAAARGRWRHDSIEPTAMALFALASARKYEALQRGATRYLLLNRQRKGAWRSTRDTAAAIYGLTAYVLNSKSALRTNAPLIVKVNGRERLKIELSDIARREHVFKFRKGLRPGSNLVELQSMGREVITAGAFLSWHNTLENIPALSSGLKLRRRLWKVLPGKGGYRKVALGKTVKAGDLLLSEMTLSASRPVRYIHVRDPLPSGFIRERLSRRYAIKGAAPYYLRAHRENRSRSTDWFIDRLHGKVSWSHLMRAELKGMKHILPARAASMYHADIAGNSREHHLTVEEMK